MARPYSPSYNSYPYVAVPKAAPPPTVSAPPRLSSHPFFVDQTPYLSTASRRLSSMSLQSTCSAASSSRYRSPSSLSSSAASPSASAVSLHWPFRKPPTSPPSDRRARHTRAASIGHASPSTPDLSPKAASLHTPAAPIDRRCLQWMREAEQHEHEWILGSVASRSTGRERVFLPDDRTEAVEVLHEPPRPSPSACEAVKRRFRLNST